MPEPTLTIRMISDTICPFCYLGWAKLQGAISTALADGIISSKPSIKLEPFLLDPSLSADTPTNKRDRYRAKFGADRLPTIEKQWDERGAPYGLKYSFGGNIRQTTASHRLLEKAFKLGGQEAQVALWEKLAKAYFEEEQDIGDHEMLADRAASANVMTKQEALDFLATKEGYEEYEAGLRQAQSLRVTGVPYFVVQERYAIPGAVDEDLWLQVIKKVAQESAV